MDAGGLPVFQNANPAQHQINNQIHTLQQQQLNQQLQHQLVQQQQQSDVLPPKRQAVVDRLKRRIENYRRRQSDSVPRFNQTFNSVCEQQNLETSVLQKKFLESKAKKAAKKTDKKQPDNTLAGNLQSSVHVQQKFLKRPSDEVEAGPDSYEPPVKLQHNGSENLTKFSVEIVQQLEFTTSAANSQPQQISTNVTVKALTNTSVKSDGGHPSGGGGGASNGATQSSQQGQTANGGGGASNGAQKSPPAASQMHDLGNLVECKQEPDHDFADLEQCAAALEKDAAANGHFPGLSDLIGDDTNDESDTFKELISDLSDFHPELLDFEEKPQVEIKEEKEQHGLMDGGGGMMKGAGSPMTQFPGGAFSDNQSCKRGFGATGGNTGGMSEMSPAAQTLKHMAEQHQHKSAMGMSFQRPSQGGGGAPNGGGQQRPNYESFGPFGGGDFIPGGGQANFHKNGPPGTTVGPTGAYPNPDMVKQEMMYAQSEFDLKRMAQMPSGPGKMGGGAPGGAYKQPGQQQQYSPYGSPGSMSNHGSPGPGFMGAPRGGPGQAPQATGPPRPPSGGAAGPQGPQGTLQMKQTQQLHISQQGPGGHGIQVSAGQHLHLSGDLKNSNVSVAAQQGVYFNQQSQQPNQPPQSQAPTASAAQGTSQAAQQNTQGIASDSYTVSQSQTINFTQQSMRQRQQQSVGGSMGNAGGGNGAGIQTMAGGTGAVTNPNMVHGNASQAQMVSMSQSQHMSVSGMVQGGQQQGGGQVSNPMTMGPNMMNQGVPGQMGQMGMNPMAVSGSGGGAMGGPNGMVGAPNAAMMAGMGPNGGPMTGMRHDPAKFMQQQQMMQRAQAMQHMQGARPPPPEYKAAQAQMIQAQMMHQGGPAGRFPNTAAAMRRISQQPIPPSGPMMRPQHSMYMQHPNHGAPRTMAPYGQRPPNVQVGPEGMPMGSQQEWRHIFMSQQQNMNFNSAGMRSNFNPNHQGFNMQNSGPGNATGGGNMQMTPMQQQMMRNQQQQPNGGQNQMVGMNQSTMQQMLAQQQQQQGMMSQMQMNTMHMSQTQSMSLQQQSVMNNFSQTTQQTNAAMISGGQTQGAQQSQSNQAPQTTSAAISPSGNDFNFEFLENIPVGDTTGFSAQDLFNSLDNDSFNLQDMLQ